MVIEGHFKTTTLEDIGGRLTGAGFMATVKECGMYCLECAILGSVLRSPTHDVNMVAVMQCPIKCHSTQLMMPELSEDAKRMIDSILENEYAAIAIKKRISKGDMMEFSDYIQLQNLIGKTLEHSCAGSVLALLEGDLTLVDQTTYDLVNNNRDAVMSPYFSEHNGYGWELLDIGGINHEGNIKYNDVYTWIDFGGGDNDGSDPGTGNEDGESDDDHTFKFWCPIACKQSYVLALSSEGDTKEDALKALLSMLTETLQRTKMAMMHS